MNTPDVSPVATVMLNACGPQTPLGQRRAVHALMRIGDPLPSLTTYSYWDQLTTNVPKHATDWHIPQLGLSVLTLPESFFRLVRETTLTRIYAVDEMTAHDVVAAFPEIPPCSRLVLSPPYQVPLEPYADAIHTRTGRMLDGVLLEELVWYDGSHTVYRPYYPGLRNTQHVVVGAL